MTPIDQKELEQEFLKLPNLKHVGMALMQFAFNLQGSKNLFRDVHGVYCMTFVSFEFQNDGEKIILFVRNVDVESEEVREFGYRWLSLNKAGDDLAVCEIIHEGQLGQAAKYIWIAKNSYMAKRIIKDSTAESN